MPDPYTMPSLPDPARWYEQMQRAMGPGNAGYPLPNQPPPEYTRAMQPQPAPQMAPAQSGRPMMPRPGLEMRALGGGLPAQLAMLMGGSASPDAQRFYEQRGAALPPQPQPQIPMDVLLRWLVAMLSPRGPEAQGRPGVPTNQP